MVLAASLVLAASIPLAWTATRPAPEAGEVPAAVTTGTSTPPPATPFLPSAPSGPPVTGGQARGAQTQPRTSSARIADLQPTSRPTPQRVAIAALGVDAPVVPVGVEPGGLMQLPVDVGDVGWYRHGPAPGEPGTAVLASHVDSRTQGPGVLFELRSLDIGALVTVTDEAGAAHDFQVVARRTYGKAELPTAELFARGGPAELAMITCGGDFDPVTGSYSDNVVVTAVPVAAAERLRTG